MGNKQIVENIVELLEAGAGVRTYGANSTTVSAQDRTILEGWTEGVLEYKLQELQAESIRIAAEKSPEVQRVNQARLRDRDEFLREQNWAKIFSTILPGNVVVVDNQAARNFIEGWVDETRDEKLSLEWFTKVIAENPKLIAQLTVQSADILDPKKRKDALYVQRLKDRDTFSAATRKYGIGDTEANFAIVRDVLGSGFNEYQVGQAAQSGAARVSPATQEELAGWAQEAAQERQNYLLSHASHAELKQAAKAEAEDGRLQAQNAHVRHQIQSRAQAEAGRFPALPEVGPDGTKYDGSFFKRLADTDFPRYKKFCSNYGFSQITERLNQV